MLLVVHVVLAASNCELQPGIILTNAAWPSTCAGREVGGTCTATCRAGFGSLNPPRSTCQRRGDFPQEWEWSDPATFQCRKGGSAHSHLTLRFGLLSHGAIECTCTTFVQAVLTSVSCYFCVPLQMCPPPTLLQTLTCCACCSNCCCCCVNSVP